MCTVPSSIFALFVIALFLVSEDGGVLGASLSPSSKVKRSADLQSVQLCGARLLEAVRGLCGGVGLSLGTPNHSRLEMPNEIEISNSVRSKRDVKTKFFRRRVKRNIIEDCCKKVCSVTRMLSYCTPA